jgi:ribonuclease P/MRP protein subunit RPP40
VLQVGVPQGSVLGPTLFLIYINDICEAVRQILMLVKSCLQMMQKCSVLDSGLSRDLNTACSRIASWAENWQMRIASNKCIALRITNKVTHETTFNDRYLLGHAYVDWCTEARDLGVLVDNKLSFNQHISNIVHKAGVRARLILCSFCSKDCRILLKAYVTYVRPLLEYCSSVWSPFTAANKNKIEAVQRNFTKNISELSTLCYNDRLFNLQLESLEFRRLVCDLVTLYKLIHTTILTFQVLILLNFILIAVREDINIKYANNILLLTHSSSVFLIDVLMYGIVYRQLLLKQ